MFSTDEERDFQRDLQKIKPGKRDPLKGKELSTILKMVFYDGFGKKEATNLKIGDVVQGGNIVGQITPTPQKGSINLSEEVKSALLDYIKAILPGLIPSVAHLCSLFPSYDRDSGKKRLQRDLKSLNIGLNFLRRDGIHHYFQILTRNGLTYAQAVKDTAGHFRKEERSIRNIIKGESWYKSEKYMDEMYRKDPIMGPFFKIEELGKYIIDEAGEMIDGFFKAVEKDKETYPGQNVAVRDILLNDMITAIFGDEISTTLKSDLNLPTDKEEGPTASQDLAVTPNRILQPKAEDLSDIMRGAKEHSVKGLQEAEERARKWEEKKGKLSALFEDPEKNHTPEEKIAFKKEKVLEIIQTVQATFSEEEKAKFLIKKKELEKSRMKAKEESKNEKQEKILRRLFREGRQIIRVGVICPESDKEHPYIVPAISLAEKQINGSGGIDGRFLGMIIRYDESSDFGALKALINCTQKEVIALLGPARSTQIYATSDMVKKYGIPMAIGGSNVTLTRKGNPWFFRCCPADSYAAEAMVKYIKEDMKLTKVGILNDSDIFGAGGADLVEQGCNNNGLTVVRKENYTTGDNAYFAKLESLKNAGAEVMVVYGTSPKDVAEIQKQYRSLGSPYAYIGSPSSGMRACLNLSGKDAEGLISIADYVPGRTATQKYAGEYKAEFFEEMDPTAVWYYDALKILEMAIRQVGTNPQAIMSAILAVKAYEGVLGTYDFTLNGDGLHKVSVIQIKNGGHQLIK